jgi:hypothetical protein
VRLAPLFFRPRGERIPNLVVAACYCQRHLVPLPIGISLLAFMAEERSPSCQIYVFGFLQPLSRHKVFVFSHAALRRCCCIWSSASPQLTWSLSPATGIVGCSDALAYCVKSVMGGNRTIYRLRDPAVGDGSVKRSGLLYLLVLR